MFDTKTIIVSALAVIVSTAAFANKGGERATFAELDANGNGEITLSEFQAHKDAKFAEADTDGNGELSFEELQAKRAEMSDKDVDEDKAAERTERKARMFAAMDKNNSGGLSKDELPGSDRLNVKFAALDADENGSISEEEFENGKGGRKGGRK